MRGVSYFFMVLGVCYLVIMGLEYKKMIEGQNWILAKAKVENAINSIPLTKYEPNGLNNIATIVNWTYIKYNYTIGPGHYDAEQELGPHLTAFDYVVGPIAVRLPKDSEINIRYNPRDPKESRLGFEVFHPVECYLGSGVVFIALGLLMFYIAKVQAASMTDDEELNQPIEYFEKKRR